MPVLNLRRQPPYERLGSICYSVLIPWCFTLRPPKWAKQIALENPSSTYKWWCLRWAKVWMTASDDSTKQRFPSIPSPKGQDTFQVYIYMNETAVAARRVPGQSVPVLGAWYHMYVRIIRDSENSWWEPGEPIILFLLRYKFDTMYFVYMMYCITLSFALSWRVYPHALGASVSQSMSKQVVLACLHIHLLGQEVAMT